MPENKHVEHTVQANCRYQVLLIGNPSDVGRRYGTWYLVPVPSTVRASYKLVRVLISGYGTGTGYGACKSLQPLHMCKTLYPYSPFYLRRRAGSLGSRSKFELSTLNRAEPSNCRLQPNIPPIHNRYTTAVDFIDSSCKNYLNTNRHLQIGWNREPQ